MPETKVLKRYLDPDEVAPRLSAARLTATDVAREWGCDRSYASRILSGQRPARASQVLSLASLAGCRASVLVHHDLDLVLEVEAQRETAA